MEPEKQLKQLIQNMVAYFSENRVEFSYIIQFEDSLYLSSTIVDERLKQIMIKFQKLFVQLHEQKSLKPLPLELLQSLLKGAVNSLVSTHLNMRELNSKEISDAVEAIWNILEK